MKPDFVRIKVFDHEIQLNFFEQFFAEENIPFFIRKYHDTAYNGIYTGQMGFGDLYIREDYMDKALQLLDIAEKELQE